MSQGLEIHTARQLELCQRLQALAACAGEGAPGSQWATLSEGAADPAIRRRWSALGQRMAAIESRISYLNQVHAALLRKAHRSAAMFARLLTSSAITYSAPEAKCAASAAQSGGE
jgi:hypothetical protein